MKIFRKTATAAILIILALFLITCVPEPPPETGGGGDAITWLDWNYEDNPDGSGKLTLMLDGSTPFAYNSQQSRALSEGMARMVHDFFEVVFVNDAGTGEVRRTSWEIGYPAGIGGLTRSKDYGNVAVGSANGSVVFVGRKQSMTLLGIGYLVQVNTGEDAWLPDNGTNTNTTEITPNAISITYAVHPLVTHVGFSGGDGGATLHTDRQTFLTAVERPLSANTGTSLIGALATKTSGKNITLPGDVVYPLFDLPPAPVPIAPATTANRTIEATYTIGLTAASTGPDDCFPPWPSTSLFDAALIGTGGLEIARRYAAYQIQGKTYDASKSLDTHTTVVATNNASGTFNSVITMTFTQNEKSAGILAITFQCPVYAITNAASTVGGGSDPIAVAAEAAKKWYIRPAFNQYQYLLDSGEDAGGMVMLGNVSEGTATNWLEIFTTGIGFSN